MTDIKASGGSFPYLPHTEEDRCDMLREIGAESFDELVAHVPVAIRAGRLALPDGLDELQLRQEISRLAGKNRPASEQACFLGGGSYRRFVPSVVSSIISRSEFATAYTPYQPEVSQGTLQAIYEFQTAVCLLTEMEVANASMYDGQTALAEAAMMACRLTGRRKVVIAGSINPEYALIVRTYLNTSGLECSIQPAAEGFCEAGAVELDSHTAAIIVQYPNYFGIVEDLPSIKKAADSQGALLIVVADPIALGVLAPPGQVGADIVVGDGQQCGNSLSFGGPTCGFMATREKFVRQLPGRLAGITVDRRGQRAFTLTLQTREQHIRRQRATSNICTNQALNALAMLVYLTIMGPQGLRDVAEISIKRAHRLAELLTSVPGFSLRFEQPFVSEFVLRSAELPVPAVLDELKTQGILGGLDLGRFVPDLSDCLLVAVTEMNMPEELERYAEALRALSTKHRAGARPSNERSALAHKS